MNRELYIDALYLSERALKTDPEHKKSLFRKAKCLAYLFQFEDAFKIMHKLES